MTFALNRFPRGFTIVDVMVTMSIISLFSSILIFYIADAKKAARDAVSVQDVKTLKTAVLQHKLENEGKAPGVNMTGFVSDSSPDFETTLKPLVDKGYITKLPKNQGIFYYNMGPGPDGEDLVVIGVTLTTGGSSGGSSGGNTNTCQPIDPSTATQALIEPPLANCYLEFSGKGDAAYSFCIVPGEEDPTFTLTECGDNLDNDNDGKIDMADGGCIAYYDNGESPEQSGPVATFEPPTGDLVIWPDHPDYIPGEYYSVDGKYYTDHTAKCANGTDDDGDGKIDLADPGCVDLNDNGEGADPPQNCLNVQSSNDYCVCT